jgi:anti-sigma factor RsiW
MTQKHVSEEQMSMHVFGDADNPAEVAQHLKECEDCAREFVRLQQVVNLVSIMPVPDKGEDYGAHVWQQIRYRLPEREQTWWQKLWAPRGLAFAAGALALIFLAFMAGRVTTPKEDKIATGGSNDGGRERVVLVAVGRHLEKTQMVLVELSNAEGKGRTDISGTQEIARDLLNDNRLYRQSAAQIGERGVTNVMEEVERFLVEVANGPSQLDPKQLASLQERLEAQGLLFKVRIVESTVENKGRTPEPAPAKGTGRI